MHSSTFETVKDLAATGLISKETFLDQYYIIYFSDSQGLDSSRYLWKYLCSNIHHVSLAAVGLIRQQQACCLEISGANIECFHPLEHSRV
jgi:hypothetical protein